MSPCSSIGFRSSVRSEVMNMSSLMDRLPTYLLIFGCFTFVCIHGRGQDFLPSCEVDLMVRRGTAWQAAPRQRLTARCPVKRCGESVHVTWCKLLDTDKCEQLNHTEIVEITQKEIHDDELISFLTFKRISIDDDGLYRCYIKGYKSEHISHIINISVSDVYHGVKHVTNADEVPGVADDEDLSWLPYFYICVGIPLLVAILIVLTLVFYHRKRILIFNHTKDATQEMPARMIPDLPKGSTPSTYSGQSRISSVNAIYSPSTAQRPPSQPPVVTNWNQSAVANTTDEGQVSDHAAHSVINHRQLGIPAREQHTTTTQYKNSEYAAINVTSYSRSVRDACR